jgi:fatty-acyl-CoA synthase
LIWQARTGRPFKAIDLRVVDDDGREVPEDGRTAGEIQVRGATVTPGYWGDPAATAEAFVEGWLKTGDLAVRFGHGFIDIVDRKKDVIISGGETIYSTEVENALYDHAGILEAAAFGVPDPVWGEIVAAAIVPRPGCLLEPNALDTFCRARIAGYKVPRCWQFLDSLPKTGSGKIAKRLLRTDRFKAP